ncbi:hypothetical protein K3495_g2184 [Podosphaera aphanis]|nr:hypothetical protein K3495_g2184 [Podosphaera aphanis]
METETMIPTGSFTKKQPDASSSSITARGPRSVINLFSYTTGKWLIGYVMIVVLLHWTSIYARTRWNLRLSRKIQFCFRIIPIFLLLVECQNLLQSLSRQSSVDFALLPGGNLSFHSILKLTQNRGAFYELSSMLLPGFSDNKESYSKTRMIASKSRGNGKISQDTETLTKLTGSITRLWPLFKTFAYSQFFEAIIHAVEGRQRAAEYVVSLLELFLAFAEEESIAESRLYLQSQEIPETFLAWGSYFSTKASKITSVHSRDPDQTNASSEALLIGLISAMNHLSNHVLAIFNKQSCYRLLNTGIWGLAYMTAITIGLFSMFSEGSVDLSFWRFPSVFIISFIPQMMIFCGIIICLVIYSVALLLTALAFPKTDYINENNQSSQWPIVWRLKSAYRNLQANDAILKTKVNLRMDFYSALLHTGYHLMNMANDAVYLNQSRGIAIMQRTWLEENRLKEFEDYDARWLKLSPRLHELDPYSSDKFSDDIGLVLTGGRTTSQREDLSGGYAREMTARTPGITSGQPARLGTHSNGAKEQSKRWYFVFLFSYDLGRLSLNFIRSLFIWIVSKSRIQSWPRWILQLLSMLSFKPKKVRVSNSTDTESLNLNVFSDSRRRKVSKTQIDVEAEFRKKIRGGKKRFSRAQERDLDTSLYLWWLSDGWWGDNDNSGSFLPSQEQDEDTSSVLSLSTNTTEDQRWESDNHEGSGQATPFQRSPHISRESTPINDTTLTPENLAQLLNPKTPDQRVEAEILAAHLSHDRVLTRSRYSTVRELARAKVLTSTFPRPGNLATSSPHHPLTLEEESQILEHLLITRRSLASRTRRRQHSPLTDIAICNSPNTPLCVIAARRFEACHY